MGYRCRRDVSCVFIVMAGISTTPVLLQDIVDIVLAS